MSTANVTARHSQASYVHLSLRYEILIIKSSECFRGGLKNHPHIHLYWHQMMNKNDPWGLSVSLQSHYIHLVTGSALLLIVPGKKKKKRLFKHLVLRNSFLDLKDIFLTMPQGDFLSFTWIDQDRGIKTLKERLKQNKKAGICSASWEILARMKYSIPQYYTEVHFRAALQWLDRYNESYHEMQSHYRQ